MGPNRVDAHHNAVLFEFGEKWAGIGVDVLDYNLRISCCALVSFIPSVLVGGPVRSISDSTGVEYIATSGVLLPLPDVVHNFARSVGFFRITTCCTVKSVNGFIAYGQFF